MPMLQKMALTCTNIQALHTENVTNKGQYQRGNSHENVTNKGHYSRGNSHENGSDVLVIERERERERDSHENVMRMATHLPRVPIRTTDREVRVGESTASAATEARI